MPILIYTSDPGTDPERFEFDFDDFTLPEVSDIEDALDMSWDNVVRLYWKSRRKVAAQILLVLMRRTEPGLTLEQLNLKVGQIGFDMTLAEQRRWVQGILDNPDTTPGDRLILEARLAELTAEQPEADAGDSGKD